MQELSHLNEDGEPTMVDVSSKQVSLRTASAECTVKFPQDVWEKLVLQGWSVHKGAIKQTAIIAGIMAAKKTSDLIPLCHPLALSKVDVLILEEAPSLLIQCTAVCEGKTGVEMEALVGCSIAGLTVYDMCKALSHDIALERTQLISKHGGKRDFER